MNRRGRPNPWDPFGPAVVGLIGRRTREGNSAAIARTVLFDDWRIFGARVLTRLVAATHEAVSAAGGFLAAQDIVGVEEAFECMDRVYGDWRDFVDALVDGDAGSVAGAVSMLWADFSQLVEDAVVLPSSPASVLVSALDTLEFEMGLVMLCGLGADDRPWLRDRLRELGAAYETHPVCASWLPALPDRPEAT